MNDRLGLAHFFAQGDAVSGSHCVAADVGRQLVHHHRQGVLAVAQPLDHPCRHEPILERGFSRAGTRDHSRA